MTWLVPLLVTLVVVTLSLLIISKLPLGVEVDSLPIAFVSAIVFGVLNGLLHPLMDFFKWTFILAPLAFLLNIIIFGLSAKLVEGFRLKWGIMSAILGSIALTLVVQVVSFLLARVGLPA
jgi:putative membrane protein